MHTVCVYEALAHACSGMPYVHMRGARSYLSIYTYRHVLCMWGTYTKVCLHGVLALASLLTLEWKGQESQDGQGGLRSPLLHQGLLAYLRGLLASTSPYTYVKSRLRE